MVDTSNYQLYYLGTVPREQRQWQEPYVQIASFDPAVVNLGLRIERRSWENVTIDSGNNGELAANFVATSAVVANVATGTLMQQGRRVKMETLAFERVNVTGVDFPQTLRNIVSLIQTFLPLLRGCHIIVMERQLKKNVMTPKIFQHLFSLFVLYLSDSPLQPDLYEVDGKWVKLQLNLTIGRKKAPKVAKGKKNSNAPVVGVAVKKVKKESNKTIMPYRVRALLWHYQDLIAWNILSQPGKKDDRADSFANIEALARAIGLPHTLDHGSQYSWAMLEQIKQYSHLHVQ